MTADPVKGLRFGLAALIIRRWQDGDEGLLPWGAQLKKPA